MKKLFLMLAFSLHVITPFAQETAGDASERPTLPGTAVERNRIQAERMREEARYQTEAAACYARFAVSDCLRGLRVHRREVLETLRRQEILLNDADRRQKGLEQIGRITEKSSEQQQEEAVTRRLDARAAQKEREDRAAQKAADAIRFKSVSPSPGTSEKVREQGRSPDERTENQQQFQNKLKAAQEHRASLEKSNAEKIGPSAKPLPAAP